jgi:putative ABC transport system ATP-binding protein
MIVLNGVTKEYRLDEKNIVASVRDVNLRITGGELIIITGHSGSGKTTLLNLTAGLVKPTLGEILIDNTNLRDMNDKQLSALRNRKIGFVFQFPSLFPNLTVLENVMFPAEVTSRSSKQEAKRLARELLATVGLEDKTGVFPKQLSAGEQKRVVISRALINQPEIILADEPTSDLDTQTENEIMQLFKGRNDTGVTCIMVTHNRQLISYATRAYQMEKGRLSEI